METQLPSPKKGQSPPILAHVYCGQTAVWINTPLGTEVDLCPGHFVLDGFPAIGERGTAASPLFGPCLLWPQSPSQLLLSSCYFKDMHVSVVMSNFNYCRKGRLALKFKCHNLLVCPLNVTFEYTVSVKSSSGLYIESRRGTINIHMSHR